MTRGGVGGPGAAGVAVVIAAKDEEARVGRTVAAVRALPGVDLVVVVDDGSTDRAPQRLRSDPRVQVVANAGRGIPTALNTGIACSTAALIGRTDGHDG